MQQFANNLARVKKISKEWNKKHRARKKQGLKDVEKEIKELYEKNKEGVFTMEEVRVLKHLEGGNDSLFL